MARLREGSVRTEHGGYIQFTPNDEGGLENAYLRVADADDTYIDSTDTKNLVKLAKILAPLLDYDGS
jgi:hypothetical protein